MTVISLRGTNGAGKSTIVRAVMDQYSGKRVEIKYPGRRKPVGYVLGVDDTRGLPGLFVPGHYEIANGGVDTLASLDDAYVLIRGHAELGMNVIYEGKNMSDGTVRLLELHKRKLPVCAVLIDISVKDAVAAVRERGHKIKRETIEKLHAKCIRDVEKLDKAGVEVFAGNRAHCMNVVKKKLGLTK